MLKMLIRYSKFSLKSSDPWCSKFKLSQEQYQMFMLLGKVFAKIGSSLSCWKKVLNEIFCQKPMLKIVWMILNARQLLEVFWCSKCSTIFLLQIAHIENSSSKLLLEIAGLEKFKILSYFWFGFWVSLVWNKMVAKIDFD